MGMSIEQAITVLGMVEAHGICIEAKDIAVETMRKYQQLQAEYENRLKADMVAMLEDLDLQIDESAAYNREVAKVQRLIRDRINALKESTDGKT